MTLRSPVVAQPGNEEAVVPAALTAPQATVAEHGAIYVASRASIPQRSQMWRGLRDAHGWKIASSWIDEAGEGQTADFTDLWDRIMREIAASEKLVLYAEQDDFPLKGAILEAGIALGMGKPVVVCLPDVKLEPRSHRPLGSWIKHRNVVRIDSLFDAMSYRAALTAGKAVPGEELAAEINRVAKRNTETVPAGQEGQPHTWNSAVETMRAECVDAVRALLSQRPGPEAVTRDALMTDPRLVEVVTDEAKRIAKALRLDAVDAKEVYRSMVSVCIQVTMAIALSQRPGQEGTLRTALKEIDSWRDCTLGKRPRDNPEENTPENEAFDRGCRMAFYRCSDRARAALSLPAPEIEKEGEK